MLIDYRLLGDRIRQQRRNKGRTQENFAEYLNVSVGYISQIERGITRVSLERLVDISHYLDCSIAVSAVVKQREKDCNTASQRIYQEQKQHGSIEPHCS